MKRVLLFALLACTLSLGAAYAQNPLNANIGQSLQGSQFGNGPVGIDTTSTNLYIPNHLNFLGNRATVTPSAIACGNSVMNSAATDNVAIFTTGANATCQLEFGQFFTNIPVCFLSNIASTIVLSYTPTTTGVNITGLPGAGQKIQSLCLGNF